MSVMSSCSTDGAASAIAAAGGVQTIVAAMLAFPGGGADSNSKVQIYCTHALQDLKQAKLGPAEPPDASAASSQPSRSLLVL